MRGESIKHLTGSKNRRNGLEKNISQQSEDQITSVLLTPVTNYLTKFIHIPGVSCFNNFWPVRVWYSQSGNELHQIFSWYKLAVELLTSMKWHQFTVAVNVVQNNTRSWSARGQEQTQSTSYSWAVFRVILMNETGDPKQMIDHCEGRWSQSSFKWTEITKLASILWQPQQE